MSTPSIAVRICVIVHEIRQQLRSILWLKYKIKDQEVFDKAYNYIEMYY